MGNQKFKLSDMIPNAWFYKLKDMNKPSKTTQTKLKKHNRLPPPPAPPSSPPSTTNPPPPAPQCQPRKSYHFTRELHVSSPLEDPPLTPPRKSKSSSKSRKSTRKSTNNNGCNCRTTATLQSHRPKSPSVMGETNVIDVGFSPRVENVPPAKKEAEHFDIVIDVDNCKYRVPGSQLGSAQLLESLSTQSYKINGFDFHLPRIITKPSGNSTKELETEKLPMLPLAPSSRRFSVSSPAAGVRLKINSPKIMARKQGQNGNFGGSGGRKSSVKKRRSISESFAVVKSSDDPQRDFKESMVEMILQNNLRASKDLEDLLACYLSLNSDEYHDVIIKVFKQIWFDLSDLKHKKFVP